MSVLKSMKNWQMGATSTLAGNAYFPSIIGRMLARALLVDNHGRLIVRVAGPAGFAPMTCENPVSVQEESVALVDQEQITTGETTLANAFGYNASASARWVQFHDVIVPLVGTEVPEITIPVPAGGAWSVSVPWIFGVGCRVAISTTGPTWTDPAANELWWNFLGAYCP